MAAAALRVLTRGALHRGGSSLAILVVALVASAAAAIGPAYYTSSQTSILRDTLATASSNSRGIELSDQTGIPGALEQLTAQTQPEFERLLPASIRNRVFSAPIAALEATAVFEGDGASTAPLVWRTDVCAHVTMRSGHCPTKAGQVMVSRSFAATQPKLIEHPIVSPGWGALTVVGVYDVPDASKPYWFGRGGTYFSHEEAANNGSSPGLDAIFTPRATIAAGTGDPQGTVVIDRLVNPDAVVAGDLPYLVAAATGLDAQFTGSNGALVLTDLPSLAGEVHASWRALEISIVLITVQLLVLVWLVMFTVVGDAIGTRGPEIALLKLRGRRRWRLLTFALGEPVALLTVALPLGVGVGVLAAGGLDHALLRDGTPVALPWTAWAAAGVATLGGIVATLFAARRTLRRSVVDQWQHADREAARRGWLLDGMAATAAAAAVLELLVGGQVTSVHSGSLGLLVPGLLGLAVAVAVSRLLPWGCRRLFGATRRRGGLGPFLAVRQVARRSAGARTTIVLATAFALATFALAAWATGQDNRALVADVQVGAPTVLTVATTTQTDRLAQVVDKVDPGGTRAAVVDSYFPADGSPTLLAVDPGRFQHVAAWRRGFASESLPELMHRLTPHVARPVSLTGDLMRVRLQVDGLHPAGGILGATVRVPGSDGAVNLSLGTIPTTTGAVTLTAALPGCPCQLQSLDLSAPATRQGGSGFSYQGTLLLTGIDTRGAGGWTTLPGLGDPSQWRQVTDGTPDPTSTLSRDGDVLRWPVDFSSFSLASLTVADFPAQIPAVVSRQFAAGSGATTLGLGGNNMVIDAFATSSTIPGAPDGGVIVDRTFAERAAAQALSALVERQVWVADGAAQRIEAGLRAGGIRIIKVENSAEQSKVYDRQGPGLASSIFLADALAAAVLAAGAALTTLAGAARRRRFEFAALGVVGARRRTLYAGVLIEQVAVLLVGALAGAAAGVAAGLLALRNVPEFVTAPSAIPLSYPVPVAPLGLFLGIAFAGLLLVAALTSIVLVAGASPDRLREMQE